MEYMKTKIRIHIQRSKNPKANKILRDRKKIFYRNKDCWTLVDDSECWKISLDEEATWGNTGMVL